VHFGNLEHNTHTSCDFGTLLWWWLWLGLGREPCVPWLPWVLVAKLRREMEEKAAQQELDILLPTFLHDVVKPQIDAAADGEMSYVPWLPWLRLPTKVLSLTAQCQQYDIIELNIMFVIELHYTICLIGFNMILQNLDFISIRCPFRSDLFACPKIPGSCDIVPDI